MSHTEFPHKARKGTVYVLSGVSHELRYHIFPMCVYAMLNYL